MIKRIAGASNSSEPSQISRIILARVMDPAAVHNDISMNAHKTMLMKLISYLHTVSPVELSIRRSLYQK